MPSPLETAIRSRLNAYLAGESPLDEFKDWLVGATWELDRGAEPAAHRLAYEVKLSLAEHSGGYITDDELRADLGRIASHVAVEAEAWALAAPQTVRADSSSTITLGGAYRSPVFGVPRVTASA